jgi:AcrR family transcriptional regulator
MSVKMSDESDLAIPASMAAAWGVAVRPNKGPKRGLTVERIVDAGVTVATTEGLAAVSMQRVAAQLGTSAMTLYRYVASKQELLTLMVDAALGPAPEYVAGEDWRAGLERWARAMRAGYLRHPWTLRIPVSGPPIAPNGTAWMEIGLRSMRDTRLAEYEKLSVILLVSGYVRNSVTTEIDLMETFFSADAPPAEVMGHYARALARLTDVQRFPAISAVLASGVLDEADHPDSEFNFGLERILDGIAALVRKPRRR